MSAVGYASREGTLWVASSLVMAIHRRPRYDVEHILRRSLPVLSFGRWDNMYTIHLWRNTCDALMIAMRYASNHVLDLKLSVKMWCCPKLALLRVLLVWFHTLVSSFLLRLL